MVVFIKGLNVVFFISFLFYYLSTSLPLFFSSLSLFLLSLPLFFFFLLYYSIPHSSVFPQFSAMAEKMSSPSPKIRGGMSSSLLDVSTCFTMRIRSSSARFAARAGETLKASPRAAESSSISARVGFEELGVESPKFRGRGPDWA